MSLSDEESMVSITQAAKVPDRICPAWKIKSVQLMWKKSNCACDDASKMTTALNLKTGSRKTK